MGYSERYWDLVNSLISRGITSRERWYRSDAAEYNFYWRKNKKGFRVHDILRDVVRHMSWSHTLSEYITKNEVVADVSHNRVFRMLVANKLNPEEVGTIILKWSGLISPRNTIWVSGNEVTGAYQFVDALMYLSPLLGRVDPGNNTNPFYVARSTLLYFWEGGKVTENNVGLCLEVFNGRHVLADNKDIFRTPVLIYANHDMRYIDAKDGNSDAWFKSLEDSMYRLHFWVPQPDDFGCITCSDMRNFLTWCTTHQTIVPNRHSLNTQCKA
ncbi:ORF14A [Falcon aviadenovirus A]|nr:ORF14A [Falcon aviadenovirus A]